MEAKEVTFFPKFDLTGHRTKREITIENFGSLGTLVLPKGTQVRVNGRVDGAWISVDAYITPSAVFFGVRIEADAIEPPWPKVPHSGSDS